MSRAFLTLLRTLRIPTFIRGCAGEALNWTTPTRNGQFASFMSVQGCNRRRHPDRHDRRLQTQKFTRGFLKIGGFTGVAWIALESAKALSVF